MILRNKVPRMLLFEEELIGLMVIFLTDGVVVISFGLVSRSCWVGFKKLN